MNRERAMLEIKCFAYRGFGYIAYNYRNVENREERGLTLMLSNKFEVLKSRVMNIEESSRRKISKDKKTILRKERSKKENPIKV